MQEQKTVKYTLVASAAIMLVSNVITVKALLMYKHPVEAAAKTQEDTYKAEYLRVMEENEALKKKVEEFQVSAEKWELYRERYGKSSRSGTARDNALERAANPVRMRVTAYTEYECDKEPDHPAFRITTSGNEVEEWFTAAAGPGLPFGTRIYVPYFRDYENKGIFVVEDRGGAIKKNCIDIYIADQKTVDGFGVKQLDVYILGE